MALNEKQLELKLCPIGFELLADEHPVEASRSGCNTVFHYCEPLDCRASYAGCLHTLEAIMDGRGHLRPECEAAYLSGTCPAIAMRKMELRADRALFFVDYKELTRRRGIEWEKEREESPVQFRRKKHRTFVPTTVVPLDDEPEVSVQSQREKPVEIQTNIMEQVLKKKVNDELNKS